MAKARNGKAKSNGARRSKAESSIGKKQAAVEMRKGDDLPLGEPVILDDGDFDLHLRSLKSAIERQKTAKNLYDGVCKAAKKVSEQLLTAIKRAVKFEGMDSADIKRQMEIDGYVLRRAGSPIQLTIHDTLFGDVNAAAAKRGGADQKAGRACHSPYPEGSDLDAIYKDAWNKSLGGQLGLSIEETDAAIAGEGHNSEDADDDDGEFAGVEEAERRDRVAAE